MHAGIVALTAAALALAACASPPPAPAPERASPATLPESTPAAPHPTPDTAAQADTAAVEPGWPDDMPSMLACRDDSECVYRGPHYPISPCCDTTGESSVRTDWAARVDALRESGVCARVECPPMERPSAAFHGPAAPQCRAICRRRACSFVCDQPSRLEAR